MKRSTKPRTALVLTGALAMTLVISSGEARQEEQTGARAGAVVTGKILFRGDAPPFPEIKIKKDNDVCGHGDRQIPEIEVDEEGRLKNVVVYLDGKFPDAEWKKPKDGYQLLQKGCTFVPYVQIVPKREKLTITNKDPILHNIHAYEVIGKAGKDLFNFAQPEQGHIRQMKMRPRRSKIISLKCDIHDFMAGWIFVADNPFCAVARDGTFTISGVPPGTHKLTAWHPILGEQSVEIELGEAGTLEHDFTFEVAK